MLNRWHEKYLKKSKIFKKKESGAVAWYEALDVSVFPAL